MAARITRWKLQHLKNYEHRITPNSPYPPDQRKKPMSDGCRTRIESYGRRNFLELVSVFTSAPVPSVTDGRDELGAGGPKPVPWA